MTKEHTRILFDLNAIGHCCGILELGGFQEEVDSHNWYSNTPVKVHRFATPEEQIKDFNSRVWQLVAEHCDNYNNYGGDYVLIASRVSKYAGQNRGQIDVLSGWFHDQGWKITAKFTNQNSGNEVTMYQYLLSNEEIHKLMEEHDFSYECEEESEEDPW